MNKLRSCLLFTICIINTGCAFAKSEIKNTGNNMINLEKPKLIALGVMWLISPLKQIH